MNYFNQNVGRIPHTFVDHITTLPEGLTYPEYDRMCKGWLNVMSTLKYTFCKADAGCVDSLQELQKIPKNSDMFFFVKRLYHAMKANEGAQIQATNGEPMCTVNIHVSRTFSITEDYYV
jgi:hypothetical protein